MDLELTLNPTVDYSDLPIELQEIIYGLFLEAGEIIVKDAQSNAPVKTGLLQSSVGFDVLPDGVSIYCECAYARFQEYGTKYIVPKLFLTSAFERGEIELNDKIDEAVSLYFAQLEVET